MKTASRSLLLLCLLVAGCTNTLDEKTTEQAAAYLFEERDGIIAVEAEHFHENSSNESPRDWYVVSASEAPPASEVAHAASASGNAYVEGLPDTRVTHDDSLIVGTNFYPEPGIVPILSYNIWINNPGTYTVWVRACSTGTEDNGIHVGLNGDWPALGQRIQWCDGKGEWTWSAAQRRDENHCGVPRTIQLNIEEPGKHTIHFSMREDGFEFDKWVMVLGDKTAPEDLGPNEQTRPDPPTN